MIKHSVFSSLFFVLGSLFLSSALFAAPREVADLPSATTPGLGDNFIGICVVLLLLLQILSHFRRKPPIEAEFATKNELDEEIQRLEQKIECIRLDNSKRHLELLRHGEQRKEEIFVRINQIHDSLNKRLSEIGMTTANAIGELRGELKRVN